LRRGNSCSKPEPKAQSDKKRDGSRIGGKARRVHFTAKTGKADASRCGKGQVLGLVGGERITAHIGGGPKHGAKAERELEKKN